MSFQNKGDSSGKKEDLYDSGRTDSGFISGGINSESFISGEIQTFDDSHKSRTDEKMDKSKEKEDYMRLDSGVDLGLSDQMSDLVIEEEPTQPPVQLTLKTGTEETSWQLYFQQDDEGDTQLHIAIIHGFIEVVFNLIRMVPSPEYLNIRNDMRQTALHLAVLTSQHRILRRLIVAGADPAMLDRNGNTPLHLAAYAGDAQCIRALTDEVSRHEIDTAKLRYKPVTVRKVSAVADLVNYEGLTTVHLAALSGNLGILKQLVNCGADVDAREGKAGRTVLHMAAELGDDTLAVCLLRDLNADPDMPNYAGRTASQVGRRHPQLVRTLVKYGAYVDPDYFTSDEEDDDDEDDDDFQMFDNGFRDLSTQGGILNAA